LSSYGSGLNDDPNDFTCELYDYERMVHGRTLLMLWDPTLRDKKAGVVRTHQDTRVHLPNWAALGGEMRRAGDWRVGRLGDAYVAYHPLGNVVVEEERDGGEWFYLRLAGPSGGIVELATPSDFATLDDYARDLGLRHVAFSKVPLWAEVDALDPKSRKTIRVRLEYRPEQRVVGGVEQSMENALAHGLMESPWARWDEVTRRLRIARPGYPSLLYDWDDAVVEEGPVPAEGR
jgi:hypothetical protein